MCYTIFVDIAIVFAFRFYYRVHILIMSTIILMTVIAVAIMVDNVKPVISAENKTRSAHMTLGYMATVWMCLQTVLGMVSWLIKIQIIKLPPKILLSFRNIHKISGYLLVIGCKIIMTLVLGVRATYR